VSLIGRSLARADAFRDGFRIDARASGAAGGMAGAIASSPGSVAGLTSGRYTQSQTHAGDQYGFFSGYPYAIINVIANRLAAQPIRIARMLPAGERPRRAFKVRSKAFVPKSMQDISHRLEILPSHRITDAIDDPNPMMIRHHLLYMTFASQEITGRGYWWMFSDPETGKDQIWPVPSHWIEPIHLPNKLFAYYRVQLPGLGEPIKVPTRQIVPFMMPDPSDPFAALAPMQAMARTVMTDFSFEMAQRMSLENGLNPGLAIMVGKPNDYAGVGQDQMTLTAEQRQQLTDAVKRRYRGVTRFDEPMILDALIKDVKPITTNPREMAFKDSGPLIRNRLTQGWGMNPITLGEIEGVNYASSGVADHHVCFAPGTGVFTAAGVKAIEDVRVGDSVMGHSGKWRRVTATMRRDYSGPAVSGAVSGVNTPALMTAEHPVGVVGREGLQWIAAGSAHGLRPALTVAAVVGVEIETARYIAELTGENGPRSAGGGLLVKLRRNGVRATIPGKFDVTRDMAFFFGLYLAEGHCDRNNGVQWSLHAKEAGYAERIEAAFWSVTKSVVKTHRRVGSPNGCQLSLRNATFAALVVSMFGRGSRDKTVPAAAFNWPVPLKLAFLQGYLAGDGSASESVVQFGSVSRSIGYGVRLLARSIGLSCHLYEYAQPTVGVIQGRTVNTAPVRYCGRFYGESRTALTGIAPGRVRRCEEPSITAAPTQYAGPVYNLSVEGDESYTLESGWAVHNCRNVYSPRTEANSQVMTCYIPPYLGGDGNGGKLMIYQEPVQPDDPEMEMNRDHEDYDRGIVNRNELRRKRGLEPIADGRFALTAGGWVAVDPDGVDTGNPGGSGGADQGGGGLDDEDDTGRDDDTDTGDDEGEDDDEDKRRPVPHKVTDDSGHEHGADGRFGSGGAAGGGGRHGTGSVADHADAHKGRAKAALAAVKKHGKKAVAAAKAVGKKAFELGLHAQWAAMNSGVNADDIADTAADYSKIINAKGAGDWLSTHLGVGGNAAAVVASHVLAYGFVKLKQAIASRSDRAGKRATSPGRRKADNHAKAKAVADLLHDLYHALKCPAADLPTVREVHDWIDAHEGDEAGEDDKGTKDKPGRPWGWGRYDTVNWRLIRKDVAAASQAIDDQHVHAMRMIRDAITPAVARLTQAAAARVREACRPGHAVSGAEVAHRAIDAHTWEKQLGAALRPVLAEVALHGAGAEWVMFRAARLAGHRGAKSATVKATGEGLPRRVVEAAATVAQSVLDKGLARTIVDGVLGSIRKAFKKSAKSGLTGPELADAVNKAALTGSAADRIVAQVSRDEGPAAINAGQAAVRIDLIRAGAVLVTEWVTEADERVRPSHRKAHGQRVRPGRAFTVGGHSCYYPGDPGLPPDQRCRCRCKAITVYARG